MTGLWIWCLPKHRLRRKCDISREGKTRRARSSRACGDKLLCGLGKGLRSAHRRSLLYARCERSLPVRETIEVEIKNKLG